MILKQYHTVQVCVNDNSQKLVTLNTIGIVPLTPYHANDAETRILAYTLHAVVGQTEATGSLW